MVAVEALTETDSTELAMAHRIGRKGWVQRGVQRHHAGVDAQAFWELNEGQRLLRPEGKKYPENRLAAALN